MEKKDEKIVCIRTKQESLDELMRSSKVFEGPVGMLIIMMMMEFITWLEKDGEGPFTKFAKQKEESEKKETT